VIGEAIEKGNETFKVKENCKERCENESYCLVHHLPENFNRRPFFLFQLDFLCFCKSYINKKLVGIDIGQDLKENHL